MTSVLAVERLKKVYGKKTPFVAVDAISFDLKPGEILGLLGPNGSGKTTTIQMLLGTLSPSGGKISYFGKDFVKFRSEILQKVSFASTYTSLPYVLTVEENLKAFGKLYGLQKPLQNAEPLLRRFGIYDKRKEKVSALSAGQVTRLMLVKAFFIEPEIVLLDEPTASLDPDIARDVCKFILEEREKKGLSILFTSHKMEEVSEVCDRVLVLKKGTIIANDLPQNLAKSVSVYRLRLSIAEEMHKTVALAERQEMVFEVDRHEIVLSLEEKEIPLFLQRLTQEAISYTGIQIEAPTLEDYFLEIARKEE